MSDSLARSLPGAGRRSAKFGNSLAGTFEKAGFDVDIQDIAGPAMLNGGFNNLYKFS
ncbi:MAG TPA: hypothetical protein VJ879_11735 [Desulfobacter sp.]|nr:hypothetical protein [Desulfobacter sp.]